MHILLLLNILAITLSALSVVAEFCERMKHLNLCCLEYFEVSKSDPYNFCYDSMKVCKLEYIIGVEFGILRIGCNSHSANWLEF
jgi:hypothetical protein